MVLEAAIPNATCSRRILAERLGEALQSAATPGQLCVESIGIGELHSFAQGPRKESLAIVGAQKGSNLAST